MYRFLYNCVFCLAFINFLNVWIFLFFSEKQKSMNSLSMLNTGSVLTKTKNKAYTETETNYAMRWRKGINQSMFYLFFIISISLWIVLTLLIFFRIFQCHHFPLANFYEALIFLTWCLVTLNLLFLFEPTNNSQLQTQPTNINNVEIGKNSQQPLFSSIRKTWLSDEMTSVLSINNKIKFIEFSLQKQVFSAILAPCILFIIAFAQFNLEETITPLVPALKSNWLLMHVSIMICSYTTFLVGGLLAFFLCFQSFYGFIQNKFQSFNVTQVAHQWFLKNKTFVLSMFNKPNYAVQWGENHRSTRWWDFPFFPSFATENLYALFRFSKNYTYEQKSIFSIQNFGFPSFENNGEKPYKMQKKNLYIYVDNLSYRMMGIGFPLFTLGILSGAVWANEAWGSYWSWDIKEVGSFINWLCVALYFHCRYKNFIGLSHIVAFISLIVLFFNFFGISLGIFGSSLHAYGAAS